MKSRIEQNHEQYFPYALVLSRGAAYAPLPQAPQAGLRSVRILLDQPDIDALIRLKLLKKDQRQDVEALQTAVTGLVYRVQENLA